MPRERRASVQRAGARLRRRGAGRAAQENLQAWMADRRGRDQFVVRWGDETEVFWNDAARGVAEEARALPNPNPPSRPP